MFLPKTRLVLGVFMLIGTLAMGQAARSPFSSIGIGEQFGSALAPNQGMGGIGFSNPQYLYINNQNPALLVYNRLTIFQAGVIGEQRTQRNDTLQEKSGSGNLNYLAVAFPVKVGWWTTSFSLLPYTRLNYQMKYIESIDGTTTNSIDVIEEGSGGINSFSWSNGVSLSPALSVGMKAAYLFSSVVSEYSNLLVNTSFPISAHVSDRTYVSDFQFTPAAHLHLDSIGRKNWRLNIGVVFDMKTSLHTKFNRQIQRWDINGLLDSVTVISNVPGSITVPNNLMLGISMTRAPYRWMAGIDASYADYSTYRDLLGKNPYATDNWKIAAGFELTPDRASLSNYLKRVTYRTGVSVENYPYLANGNMVKDFGITFGLSLPVNRISSLDFAFRWGRKGDQKLNLLEENYFKIYFGITFNDQWFIKRRFD